MTSLDRPDLRFRESWEEAVAEFAAADDFMHGSGVWEFDELDTSAAGAPAVIAHLLAQADPAIAPPEDRVHCTYFWITDGGEFVGYLALRHSLTAWLFEEGGHIGYSVRPSRRREGHATRALRLAVAAAAELGIDRALVTCDDDNDGSRAVIERAGGVYEDTRNGKRRYWIDTGLTAGGTSPRTAGRAAPA